jgi:hypothetical protein
VQTVASFDHAADQRPEIIIINPDGSRIISMVGVETGKPPELVRLERSGSVTVACHRAPCGARKIRLRC